LDPLNGLANVVVTDKGRKQQTMRGGGIYQIWRWAKRRIHLDPIFTVYTGFAYCRMGLKNPVVLGKGC